MPHDLNALTRQWFEQVWNRRNAALIPQLLRNDAVIHGLPAPAAPTDAHDHFMHFYRQFLAAFPDLKITSDDVVVQGDEAVVRLSLTGTHKAPWATLTTATNRPVHATAIVWARWQNGQIAEAWNELDVAGMLRQLTQ